jgi:hypothetical protein
MLESGIGIKGRVDLIYFFKKLKLIDWRIDQISCKIIRSHFKTPNFRILDTMISTGYRCKNRF